MAFCTTTNCTQEAAWRVLCMGYPGGNTDQMLCRDHGAMPALPEVPGQYAVTILGPFDELQPETQL